MIEVWEDVTEYEGLYQVSNLGNIRSLDRQNRHSRQLIRNIKGRLLKPHYNTSRQGYYEVSLHKEGKEKRYRVHRLVATAFISNPENKPEVNHKDGDKSNNTVENLEWVTGSENSIHAWKTDLCKRKIPMADYTVIYELNKVSRIKQYEIAKIYGVNVTAIERVVRYVREHGGINEQTVI